MLGSVIRILTWGAIARVWKRRLATCGNLMKRMLSRLSVGAEAAERDAEILPACIDD